MYVYYMYIFSLNFDLFDPPPPPPINFGLSVGYIVRQMCSKFWKVFVGSQLFYTLHLFWTIRATSYMYHL